MANFALIKNNIVHNIVVVEEPENPELLFPDYLSVEITEEYGVVAIGYTYSDGSFISNIVPETSDIVDENITTD